MKRLALALLVTGILGSAVYGQTLDGFKTAVSTFADSMAGTLALDSTTGGVWSQSYIGGFPHFGVGLSVGASFTGAAAMDTISSALGQATPEALQAQGIPIPTAAGTLRIGLPFLPMDIAVKGMVLPPEAAASLKSSSGISADIQNLGLQLRYSLVKEGLFRPAISFGIGGTYQSGNVVYQTSAGSQTMTCGSYEVGYSDPAVKLGWESLTFDASLQVSKTILFLTPYAGAGLTFGKSRVRGGVDSAVTVYDTSTSSYVPVQDLEDYLVANGQTDPFAGLSQGFMYTANATRPLVRLYAGLSINILVVLDAEVMYVPATKALGGSLTARVQL